MALKSGYALRLIALGLLVALAELWALGVATASPQLTAPTCKGSLRLVADTEQLRSAFRDVRRGALAPGSVIRLDPATFQLQRDGEPLSLDNVIGTSEECPITIEGARNGVLVDGNRYPQNTQFGHLLRVASSPDTLGLLDVQPKVFELKSIGMPKEAPINCLKIERSSWIVISNIDIAGCWPTAVYLRDARYITVKGAKISGSTYAIIAHGRSHHILVEDVVWTQDTTGDVWARIPWGVSHHGSKAHLNGALFGGYNIKGSVVIRRNVVRHAYNGIRIKSTCPKAAHCDTNMNVEIYDNRFAFIRDNSIEPEGMAINWWIRHNKMQDVHAPFSFDGVRGGPHYVFGNVGWFTQMPEEKCDDAAWANDREWLGTLTAHRECRRHRMGKTFKLGNSQKEPLHIFHNSWLARSPLIGGGRSGPLLAWNNAIEFCDRDENAVICKAPAYLMATGGRNRFKWISRSKTRAANHNIRYNLSNRPVFPQDLTKPGFPLAGRWAAEVGFVAPRDGDFRLRPGSAARQAGCLVAKQPTGRLQCTRPPDRLIPDVGAYQGQQLFKGPVFRHVDGAKGADSLYVERPRVVDLAFNRMQRDRFHISFSVPVKLDDAAVQATVRSTTAKAPLAAECRVNTARPAELECVLASGAIAERDVTAIVLPREIYRRDGHSASMTLWASSDQRLRFAN